MKVAIVHDYFNKKGGGEKLVLNLAEELDADIYTGFVDKKKTYSNIRKYNLRELSIPIKNPIIRIFKLHKEFLKLDLESYDAVILSGTTCISAARNNHPNIWYCHTPIRHLYSQKEWFFKQLNMFQRMMMFLFHLYLKPVDKRNVENVDKIVCNSKNVQDRVRKFYGKSFYEKSTVVYPPIETDKFKWKGQEDYYLSFGRVDKLKRVSLIADAFKKMSDKKLVIVSGGPELERIKEECKDFSNIDIRGYVSSKELEELVGKCIATIYIPVDEDFGMSPLEGMAAGKPCIGVNDGGLKETIVHKKTGFLCPEDIAEKDLVKAVSWMTSEKAKDMKKDCVERAKKFNLKNFISGMKKEIKRILE